MAHLARVGVVTNCLALGRGASGPSSSWAVWNNLVMDRPRLPRVAPSCNPTRLSGSHIDVFSPAALHRVSGRPTCHSRVRDHRQPTQRGKYSSGSVLVRRLAHRINHRGRHPWLPNSHRGDYSPQVVSASVSEPRGIFSIPLGGVKLVLAVVCRVGYSGPFAKGLCLRILRLRDLLLFGSDGRAKT